MHFEKLKITPHVVFFWVCRREVREVTLVAWKR